MATVYCAFCGQGRKVESRPTSEEHKREALEHMAKCEKHPVHRLRAAIADVRDAAADHHGDQPASVLLHSLTVDIPSMCDAALLPS